MTEGAMPRLDGSPGEAADRLRRRRRTIGLAVLFAVGVPIGYFAGRLEEGETGGVLTGTLPPWFALLAAAVTVAAIAGGGAWLNRRTDELDRRDNRIAASVGLSAFMALYPGWFLLWKGGWTGEPSHMALFVGTYLITAATYAVLKFRNR